MNKEDERKAYESQSKDANKKGVNSDKDGKVVETFTLEGLIQKGGL